MDKVLYLSIISVISLLIALTFHSYRTIKYKKFDHDPSSFFLLLGYALGIISFFFFNFRKKITKLKLWLLDLIAYVLFISFPYFCYLLGVAISFGLASGCIINCFGIYASYSPFFFFFVYLSSLIGIHLVLSIFNIKVRTIYYYLISFILSFSIGTFWDYWRDGFF